MKTKEKLRKMEEELETLKELLFESRVIVKEDFEAKLRLNQE